MAEEAETTDVPVEGTPATEEKAEETVSRERYLSLSKNKKVAEDRAKQLEKDLAELKAQFEERENAGLPELERERKRAEQLEKRAAEAEKKAEEASQAVLTSQRERWVTAAAQAQNFADPSDASAFVNLSEIEDEKDAERAVKRLAAKKSHLLKADEPKLPGRVMQNGQATTSPTKPGGIDPLGEATGLAAELEKFLKKRKSATL